MQPDTVVGQAIATPNRIARNTAVAQSPATVTRMAPNTAADTPTMRRNFAGWQANYPFAHPERTLRGNRFQPGPALPLAPVVQNLNAYGIIDTVNATETAAPPPRWQRFLFREHTTGLNRYAWYIVVGFGLLLLGVIMVIVMTARRQFNHGRQ